MGKIKEFQFSPGQKIAGKYIVQAHLGGGWEGEVYRVVEQHTNIIRAAKFFYPHRNLQNKTSTRFAKKLHKLSDCSMVMNYHAQEIILFQDQKIICLICEFIEGEMLSQILERQKGKRLSDFQALHLLYALAKGIENIHFYGEYHGDLHTDNIIVRRYGLGFDIKVIDLHHWGDSKKDNRDEDIIKMIRVFYDALGGERFYRRQPKAVKGIIKGLKRNLILKEFRTASDLRWHLENLDWEYGK